MFSRFPLRSPLDKAIAASLLAMAAMNIFVLAQQLQQPAALALAGAAPALLA